ncbi:hypothetical protein [Caulobacter sp. NIBR1757]|uniref:hypothetical protein n=1 Tax=Caulobacter sp. NIBR1757 TaxID=3016000 RepID=UPI0022F02607|nr:hypothetical protein [Caulobacter sp. NIBR1757]WGM41134.1 hypothetical protein AMEJIAPC_04083 [Caulobacter sp. NIBR1757]
MQTPQQWVELGRRGAFTTTQVAALIGAEPSKVASWLSGSPPLIESDLPTVAGRIALSFDGLVEARAVSYLLAEGVTRRRLAKAMKAMRQRWADPHPLARERQLTTDGSAVFELQGEKIIDLLTDAYLHPEVLRPALAGRVVFKSGRAAWLEPYPADLPLVRIDPARAFGRPVVVEQETAVPTEVLAASAQVDGLAEAADWFNVSKGAVTQAVEFEHRIAA